ncbi:MAG: glycosyltransferase family 2 protein [Verrucomicrobiales bacterium]
MKLVMTLLVRNEADILATNIEYHLRRGVDFFIATDNLSEDGTRDVLEHYRQQNLLHLIRETDDNYSQSHWVTRMAHMAAVDFQADWVINSDADEFWWPEESNDLKELLAKVPTEIDALRVSRSNFVPLADGGQGNFIDTMTVRERESRNGYGNPLPPKVCHRGYHDITVSMGNHAVSRTGGPIAVGTAPLSIFHFPVRSFTQLALKVSLGGAALERNENLDRGAGKVWRMLYRKWQHGDLEAYYRDQSFTEASLKTAIESRQLVQDERLRNFMRHSDATE